MRYRIGIVVMMIWLCGCGGQKTTTPVDDLITDEEAENRVVATIEKLGGKAIRDETRNGKPVVGVNLSLSAVKDSDLKELTHLKSLANLSLANTKVTDSGIKDLSPLKALTNLTLLNTRVTETGVNELKKSLPNCKIVR